MNIELKLLVLAGMFFCYIVDDYYLQGILAQMKQRKYWQKYSYMYQNDYAIALFEHAYSWAFVSSLPLLVCALTGHGSIAFLLVAYFINTIIHARIDDTKANLLRINLIQDQFLHFIQLVTTWVLFMFVF